VSGQGVQADLIRLVVKLYKFIGMHLVVLSLFIYFLFMNNLVSSDSAHTKFAKYNLRKSRGCHVCKCRTAYLMCSEVTICIHTKLHPNFLLANTIKVKAKYSLLLFAMLFFHILPPQK
jgi:hypothetical protein